MPLYEYRCEACGATEEHVQRFDDPPMTECEACGGRLKKQLTGAAFHLKGGGWYKDGYASSKPEAGSKSGDSAGSSSGGDSKSTGGDSGGGSKATGSSGGGKEGSGSKQGGGSKEGGGSKAGSSKASSSE